MLLAAARTKTFVQVPCVNTLGFKSVCLYLNFFEHKTARFFCTTTDNEHHNSKMKNFAIEFPYQMYCKDQVSPQSVRSFLITKQSGGFSLCGWAQKSFANRCKSSMLWSWRVSGSSSNAKHAPTTCRACKGVVTKIPWKVLVNRVEEVCSGFKIRRK